MDLSKSATKLSVHPQSAPEKKTLSLHHWKDSHMKPNGVLHSDFNFFGLTLPLQKLAFVPRFSSVNQVSSLNNRFLRTFVAFVQLPPRTEGANQFSERPAEAPPASPLQLKTAMSKWSALWWRQAPIWRPWTPMVLDSEIVLKKRFEDDEVCGHQEWGV